MNFHMWKEREQKTYLVLILFFESPNQRHDIVKQTITVLYNNHNNNQA